MLRVVRGLLLSLAFLSAGCARPAPPARPAPAPQGSRVIIRAPSPDEELDYLLGTLSKLTFFRENNYTVALPDHPTFREPHPAGDRGRLRALFVGEVFRPDAYAAGLAALTAFERIRPRVLERMRAMNRRWKLRLYDRYQVVLTLYGPGGSYDPRRGRIVLLTTRDGRFKRPGSHTIVHEMVHLGIQGTIVERFRLTHWEKERVVDLICLRRFGDLLPGYRMQPNPRGREVDAYVDRHGLADLPAAIVAYVKDHPRP
jgi:hypothetical protein